MTPAGALCRRAVCWLCGVLPLACRCCFPIPHVIGRLLISAERTWPTQLGSLVRWIGASCNPGDPLSFGSLQTVVFCRSGLYMCLEYMWNIRSARHCIRTRYGYIGCIYILAWLVHFPSRLIALPDSNHIHRWS